MVFNIVVLGFFYVLIKIWKYKYNYTINNEPILFYLSHLRVSLHLQNLERLHKVF